MTKMGLIGTAMGLAAIASGIYMSHPANSKQSLAGITYDISTNLKESWETYLERIVRKDGENYILHFDKDEINSAMDYELKCSPEALEAWKKVMHEKERESGKKFGITDFYEATHKLNNLKDLGDLEELTLREISEGFKK